MAIERKKKRSAIVLFFEIIFLGLLISLIFRAFIGQGFVVTDDSMNSSLIEGDIIAVEKVSIRNDDFDLGDILVYKYPINPRKFFAHRYIAGPGQEVRIEDKVLYIDGEAFGDPYAIFNDPHVEDGILSSRDNWGPNVVPEDSIFVLGDNRDYALDSRFFGYVPIDYIYARPIFIYFSLHPSEPSPNFDSFISIFSIAVHYIKEFPGRIRWERIGKSINM
jgi:signal peptidase I